MSLDDIKYDPRKPAQKPRRSSINVDSLDEISDDLGTIRAGRFEAWLDDNLRMMISGEDVYDEYGIHAHLVGFDDKMNPQFWISADDGTGTFCNGGVVLGVDGIVDTDGGKLITSGNNVVDTLADGYLGLANTLGSSYPTFPNNDFASGDLTYWTVSSAAAEVVVDTKSKSGYAVLLSDGGVIVSDQIAISPPDMGYYRIGITSRGDTGGRAKVTLKYYTSGGAYKGSHTITTKAFTAYRDTIDYVLPPVRQVIQRVTVTVEQLNTAKPVYVSDINIRLIVGALKGSGMLISGPNALYRKNDGWYENILGVETKLGYVAPPASLAVRYKNSTKAAIGPTYTTTTVNSYAYAKQRIQVYRPIKIAEIRADIYQADDYYIQIYDLEEADVLHTSDTVTVTAAGQATFTFDDAILLGGRYWVRIVPTANRRWRAYADSDRIYTDLEIYGHAYYGTYESESRLPIRFVLYEYELVEA